MKLIIDLPKKVVTAIQNGEDYRYDIHTAIAQGKPYEENPKYFPPCEDCNKKMDEIRQAYDMMKAMERPQCEWIRTQLRGRTYFVCDKCHARYDLMFDYCPHCGAEMSSKATSEQSTKTSDDAKKIADAAYERIMRGDLTGGFPANPRRRNA